MTVDIGWLFMPPLAFGADSLGGSSSVIERRLSRKGVVVKLRLQILHLE